MFDIVSTPQEAPVVVPASPKVTSDLSWFTTSITQPIARKRLVLKLSKLLTMAKAHQANGLAPGATEYQILHTEANQLVSTYGTRYAIPQENLLAQLPALVVLERYTHAETGKKAGLGVAGIGLLVIFCPVLLGVAIGLFHAVSYFTATHLGAH